MSSPSGAVSTLSGLFSFAGPALGTLPGRVSMSRSDLSMPAGIPEMLDDDTGLAVGARATGNGGRDERECMAHAIGGARSRNRMRDVSQRRVRNPGALARRLAASLSAVRTRRVNEARSGSPCCCARCGGANDIGGFEHKRLAAAPASSSTQRFDRRGKLTCWHGCSNEHVYRLIQSPFQFMDGGRMPCAEIGVHVAVTHIHAEFNEPALVTSAQFYAPSRNVSFPRAYISLHIFF
jgi:hypothetical protein